LSQTSPNDSIERMTATGSGLDHPAAWSRLAASRLAQFSLIAGIWLYVVLLHAGNDGLWFEGDAGRHAINGLFWGDFLAAIPSDPKDFALRYYARYPTITPVAYPPLFYFLEAAGYSLIGPSPFVAKGLVQVFALVGALYVAAWLRRWVRPEAGWGGALFLLQPGVIMWSHAVMLNVPSAAVSAAALFHARLWLESGSSRHGWCAVAFMLTAVLTYFLAAVTLLVVPLWLATYPRHGSLLNRHAGGIAIAITVLLLLPVTLVITRWAPLTLAWAMPKMYRILDAESWLYYLAAERQLLDRAVLFLIVLGAIAGIIDRTVRREVGLVAIWLAVFYVVLSTLTVRDVRYGLLLVPALVIVATIGLCSVSRAAASIFGGELSRYLCAGLAALIALGAYGAKVRQIPIVEGFRGVVSFLQAQADGGRVLYEGDYDGVFTFYLRSQDPGFHWAVVRGSKLLYSSAILPTFRLTERISSAKDVIPILRKECGCAWIAIERKKGPDQVAATGYLREALRRPEFERVASFPIESPLTSSVDLYRVLMPIEVPQTLELPFPVLGEGTSFRVRPISPR